MATQNYWRSDVVDQVKARIKAELSEIELSQGLDARLDFIMKEIGKRDEASSPDDLLERFVYCMSALVQHERYGGLRSSNVNEIKKIITFTLTAQLSDLYNSRLSYLFFDFLSVVSQIERRDGMHVESTWHTLTSLSIKRHSRNPDASRQMLGLALRMLRVGEIDRTIKILDEIEVMNPVADVLERSLFAKFSCYRLAGQIAEAKAVIPQINRVVTSERSQLESQWLAVTLQTIETGDVYPLRRLIKTKGTHHHPIYFLEGYLWCKVFDPKMKLERVASKAKPASLHLTQYGFFYELALTIEQGYDLDLNIHHRLEQFLKVVARRQESLSMEREMLGLLAVGRCLSSMDAHLHAEFCLQLYAQLSKQCSSGRDANVLCAPIPAEKGFEWGQMKSLPAPNLKRLSAFGK